MDSFDPPKFEALLRLSGPVGALELMTHLDRDLTSVATALVAAEQTDDRAALRAQSHILLAIAGSIGADTVYALATRLNEAVRDPTAAVALDDLNELRPELDNLITRLALRHAQLLGQA